MEAEGAFFKFAVKCSFAADVYKIMMVSLMQNLSDVRLLSFVYASNNWGHFAGDVKVYGVIKCGEFDTPLETPFHFIQEFGLECLF